MTNFLHQSLGLNKVDGDVNSVPVGKWDGIVAKSTLVYVSSKDTLNHVINYKITEGEYKGRNKDEWFTLAKEPRLKDGSTPDKGEVLVTDLGSSTPNQDEVAMTWYKKRLLDLGFTNAQIDAGEVDFSDLVNIPVTFGIKHKDGYNNINFVETRNGVTAAASAETTSVAAPASLDF